MRAIVERACGLDVHQATVVACVLVGLANEEPRKEIRTFTTMTRDLVALRQWLRGWGVTHVGMESTGVYWKPVYAILEGHFELIVGNAQHMKNVPGRKTDVKDAEWIAELVRLGMIRPSFVPPEPIRALRDLLRYRTKLVQAQSAERNRLLKVLELANIKLSSVLSDVFGTSGMLMLKALVEGRASLKDMAQLAKGRLRPKIPQVELALEGDLREHHRLLLGLQIERLERLADDLAKTEGWITERLPPYAKQLELLKQIPGVDGVVAAIIIAELGVDMSVFRSEHHAASWAGVCPGNRQSAKKRGSGRTNYGNPHLRTMLVQAALAASRKKGTYLKSKYYRLRARIGNKGAAVAVAHKILIAAFHMLATGHPYRELGDTYLDNLSKKSLTRSLLRRLEGLGYSVTIEPIPAKSLHDSPGETLET